MPRTVELEEFAGQARVMVESAVSRGEALVVLRDGAPVAVLAPTSSVPVGDLPRWEEWINDVRESFAQTTGQPGTPRVPLPDAARRRSRADPTRGSRRCARD